MNPARRERPRVGNESTLFDPVSDAIVSSDRHDPIDPVNISEAWPMRILRWRLTYVTLAALLLILEYESSALIQFPITFAIPVILASWFCAPDIGYLFAIGMAVVRLSFDMVWDRSALLQSGIINALINVSVLLFIAYITNRAVRLTREIKVLQGILPTCCFCKKIRDKDDRWRAMEVYIENRTEAQFSHGICPECAQLHYGDILNKTSPPQDPPPS